MWQNPCVDIFRKFSFFDGQPISKVGGVSKELDSAIGKKIYNIKGTTPSSNYILAPTGSTKSLGLVGRYIYLFVKDSDSLSIWTSLFPTQTILEFLLASYSKLKNLRTHFLCLYPLP